MHCTNVLLIQRIGGAEIAGPDNAGVGNDRPYGNGGHCRTANINGVADQSSCPNGTHFKTSKSHLKTV